MGEACSAQLPPPSALLNLPPQFIFPISRRVSREGRWWNRSHPAECLCALWVWQMVKKDSIEEQFCGFLPVSAGSFSILDPGRMRLYSESSFESLSSAPGHLAVHLISTRCPFSCPHCMAFRPTNQQAVSHQWSSVAHQNIPSPDRF